MPSDPLFHLDVVDYFQGFFCHEFITVPLMGDGAVAAVFDTFFIVVSKVPSAFIAKRIRRAKAKQAIVFGRVHSLMTREILAFDVGEKFKMCVFLVGFLVFHTIHLLLRVEPVFLPRLVETSPDLRCFLNFKNSIPQ
jgi:hypothetical protein